MHTQIIINIITIITIMGYLSTSEMASQARPRALATSINKVTL
jgi:hypothetical protein